MRRALVAPLLAVALLCTTSALADQPRDLVVQPRPGASGLSAYTDSWAVLIGINDYQHARIPKLQYAVNDATAVERVLLAQGFRPDRIIRLLDREATKARIETVLGDELKQKTGPNDRVLVFFAGHGKTDRLKSGEEEGYLIPVDGDPSRPFSTAVSMSALRQISDRLPAKRISYRMTAMPIISPPLAIPSKFCTKSWALCQQERLWWCWMRAFPGLAGGACWPKGRGRWW